MEFCVPFAWKKKKKKKQKKQKDFYLMIEYS